MDKYERRRLALRKLVERFTKGGIALVAEEIGKDASYVSRMLYPEGKAGKKRIGEDSAEILTEKFPDWLSFEEPQGATDQTNRAEIKPKSGTVKELTQPINKEIAEVVRLMEETDHDGRIKALTGVKFALSGHLRADKRKQQS